MSPSELMLDLLIPPASLKVHESSTWLCFTANQAVTEHPFGFQNVLLYLKFGQKKPSLNKK